MESQRSLPKLGSSRTSALFELRVWKRFFLVSFFKIAQFFNRVTEIRSIR